MCDEFISRVEEVIAPIAQEMSVELVELNIKKRDKIVVIDVIADKFKGGITLDECTILNKKVVGKIEEKQIFGNNFVVEVASPGLDRALKTFKDFNRAKGRKIRIHLLEPIEGKVEHYGKIAEVNETQVQISRKNQMITIPLESISKAVQILNEDTT